MLLIHKISIYFLRIILWPFFFRKSIDLELHGPGFAGFQKEVHPGFYLHNIGSGSKTNKFKVETTVKKTATFAVRKRGFFERNIYKIINFVGIKTAQHSYFSIAPFNDVIREDVLNNKLMVDELVNIFYSSYRSFFNVKYLFSGRGRLWVESDFRFFLVRKSLLQNDLKKISKTLANLKKMLVHVPVTHSHTFEVERLMKINGFFNGLLICAILELIWWCISDMFLKTPQLLSVKDMMTDVLKVSLVLSVLGFIYIFFSTKDRGTGIFAIKYNFMRSILCVYCLVFFILGDINCLGYEYQQYEAIIQDKNKYTRSRSSGYTYEIELIVPELRQELSFKTSRTNFERTEIGSKVNVKLYDGLLGHQWWDREYTQSV